MTAWHRIGNLVVCRDPFELFADDPKRLWGLHERDVYTIAELRFVADAEVSPVLFRLAEIGKPSPRYPAPFYPAQRFTPIATPRIDRFHAILAACNSRSRRSTAWRDT